MQTDALTAPSPGGAARGWASAPRAPPPFGTDADCVAVRRPAQLPGSTRSAPKVWAYGSVCQWAGSTGLLGLCSCAAPTCGQCATANTPEGCLPAACAGASPRPRHGSQALHTRAAAAARPATLRVRHPRCRSRQPLRLAAPACPALQPAGASIPVVRCGAARAAAALQVCEEHSGGVRHQWKEGVYHAECAVSHACMQHGLDQSCSANTSLSQHARVRARTSAHSCECKLGTGQLI